MALTDEEEEALRAEYQTFKANSVSKDELQRRLDAKNAFITVLETEKTSLSTRFSDLEAKHAEYQKHTDTKLMLGENGVSNKDAQGLLLHRYGQLPEEGRPALSAWIGKDGAARTDPYLAAVFAAPVEDKKEEQEPKEKRRSVMPIVKIDGATVTKFTPENITMLSEADKRKYHDKIMTDLGY